MCEKRLSDELAAVERMLGSLTPTPSNVQRDRLMFLAGQASTEETRLRAVPRVAAWLWPSFTAASLLAATTFGLLWAAGNKPDVVHHVVYVPSPSLPMAFDVPDAGSPPSPWDHRRLCQLILEKGIDALPRGEGSSIPDARPPSQTQDHREQLKQLLNNPTS